MANRSNFVGKNTMYTAITAVVAVFILTVGFVATGSALSAKYNEGYYYCVYWPDCGGKMTCPYGNQYLGACGEQKVNQAFKLNCNKKKICLHKYEEE